MEFRRVLFRAPSVPFHRLKIADGLREIGWLQFNADALAAHAGGTIDFAANAKEWRQNRIAGVAPQVDVSLEHVELQRRNMAPLVANPNATILEYPRLVYVHPHGRSIALTDVNWCWTTRRRGQLWSAGMNVGGRHTKQKTKEK